MEQVDYSSGELLTVSRKLPIETKEKGLKVVFFRKCQFQYQGFSLTFVTLASPQSWNQRKIF